jgi:hypothetical protein
VPVQGELSLENIKVIRNDLSDADLEVVTRKMAPVKKVESEAPEWMPAKNPHPQKSEGFSTMFSAVNP